jgi:hypothetical protein
VKLTAFVAAVLLGTTAMAQTAPAAEAPKPTWTFALHGFVSMSAAYQSGAFILSEGQQSLGSATNAASATAVPDKNSLTFDVRQSRFNFSVQGPKVLMGATPTGVMEIDFMQGFGGGNYGDVSLLNRLRVAYAELNWGTNKLQLGQQNDLIFAMAPTSLSHIAFPLGYFTGNVGWRRPGVFGYHTVALPSDLKLEAAWEVGRSQWADASNGGAAGVTIGGAAANTPGGINLGEASGAPALEGRVTLGYAKLLTAFVGAHWQNIDLSGYGSGASPIVGKATVQTTAFNGGLKLTLPVSGDMGLTVQGTGFTGKNVGPLIANFTTAAKAFNVGPKGEDVATMGYWAQVGFNLTKEFSLWALYGAQAIDKKDFVRAGYGANSAYEGNTTNVIAMYREGGAGLSAEWIHFETKYSAAVDVPTLAVTSNRTSKSDQYMLSANYFF